VDAPFGSLADGLGDIVTQANEWVGLVERTALIVAIVVFAVPVVVYLVKWLPGRARFAWRSSRTKRLLRADQGLELFALRALVHAPVTQLAKVGPDPLAAWRAGDEVAIRRLAALALAADGLALPKARRSPAALARARARLFAGAESGPHAARRHEERR